MDLSIAYRTSSGNSGQASRTVAVYGSENREAMAVRRQWMKLIGCSDKEIADQCDHVVDLDLEEELEQLAAAMRLSQSGSQVNP